MTCSMHVKLDNSFNNSFSVTTWAMKIGNFSNNFMVLGWNGRTNQYCGECQKVLTFPSSGWLPCLRTTDTMEACLVYIRIRVTLGVETALMVTRSSAWPAATSTSDVHSPLVPRRAMGAASLLLVAWMLMCSLLMEESNSGHSPESNIIYYQTHLQPTGNAYPHTEKIWNFCWINLVVMVGDGSQHL